MKPASVLEHIHINEYSATPKYQQLANAIISAIENGNIKKDEMLPSINELSYALEISRDTAEKGYKHLKQLEVLGSVPGKGYYVTNADFKRKLQIVLFFNKLSAHKKIVYDAFVDAIGSDASVDFYVYNNDLSLFRKLLENLRQTYTHYVIIPHFIEGRDKAGEIINNIPKEKLVLVDKLVPEVGGEYAAVYENFEKDIYNALEQAKERLSKYHTLKLIFPDKSYFPKGIIKGFYRFCQQYAFNHLLVSDISDEPISAGEVYINLMEDDLVKLLDRIIPLKLKIGRDVGIISYNETPLKKFILDGITTISTDFKRMGETAARLILEDTQRHEEVPFYLTLRQSI
ncbi:GntR family transcriptional regulator [Parapedobacter soli]|uniref:GntR family transcriptional regulator n=1 Tax=Parapedobacter soli TaxID=416955 RepID=UPI0021C9B5F6|nr:GntR family transcriptional regulator [Parapedobacter soli]